MRVLAIVWWCYGVAAVWYSYDSMVALRCGGSALRWSTDERLDMPVS